MFDGEELVVDRQVGDAFNRPDGGFVLEMFDRAAGLDRDDRRVDVADRERGADPGDDVIAVVITGSSELRWGWVPVG